MKPELPTGKIAVKPGNITLGAEALQVTIHGRGGHGATPHKAKDPVVLAAQVVLALQTIVSREVNPVETAILTVGAIQGGTLPNVIPERVTLKLMNRFSTMEVGSQMRSSVERIARGIAEAAGVPSSLLPEVFGPEHPYPPVFNDPLLAKRMEKLWQEVFGPENVIQIPTQSISDDFGEFGCDDPPSPPGFLFRRLHRPGSLPGSGIGTGKNPRPPQPWLCSGAEGNSANRPSGHDNGGFKSVPVSGEPPFQGEKVKRQGGNKAERVFTCSLFHLLLNCDLLLTPGLCLRQKYT